MRHPARGLQGGVARARRRVVTRRRRRPSGTARGVRARVRPSLPVARRRRARRRATRGGVQARGLEPHGRRRCAVPGVCRIEAHGFADPHWHASLVVRKRGQLSTLGEPEGGVKKPLYLFTAEPGATVARVIYVPGVQDGRIHRRTASLLADFATSRSGSTRTAKSGASRAPMSAGVSVAIALVALRALRAARADLRRPRGSVRSLGADAVAVERWLAWAHGRPA